MNYFKLKSSSSNNTNSKNSQSNLATKMYVTELILL